VVAAEVAEQADQGGLGGEVGGRVAGLLGAPDVRGEGDGLVDGGQQQDW
jgi:hypothetical protein